MRRNFLVLLLLFGLCAPVFAQAAGSGQDLFLGGYNTGSGTNWMIQIDRAGTANTLNTGIGGWNVWGNVFGMCTDWDNNRVLVPGIAGTANPLQIGIFQYDPISMAVVGTVTVGPISTLTMNNWANFGLNSNGNPVTVDNSTTPQAVIEFDRFSQSWMRHAAPIIPAGSAGGISGCEWDKLMGGILHADWGNTSTLSGPLSGSALYKTDYMGTTAQLAANATRVARYGGTQVDNGDWISTTCCTAQYYIVKAGAKRSWAVGPTGSSTIAYEVTSEKFAAPGRGVWVYNYSPARQIKYIDLVSGAVTTLYTNTLGTVYEVTPLWKRDVGTVRTGKASWLVSVAPDKPKAFAGKTFVLAASLAPPVNIPLNKGGREIFIGIDKLTELTVAGPIPPFLTGNSGALDANGRAMAKLDLSLLGTKANGIVAHFCAVVLDKAAPQGIAWVCEPHAFVIDVQK